MNGRAIDLNALFEAFNRHDAEAAVAFMTDDVVVRDAWRPRGLWHADRGPGRRARCVRRRLGELS